MSSTYTFASTSPAGLELPASRAIRDDDIIEILAPYAPAPIMAPPLPEETVFYPRMPTHIAHKHTRDDSADEDDGYEAGCESETLPRKRRRTASRTNSASALPPAGERGYAWLPAPVAPRLIRRTAFIKAGADLPQWSPAVNNNESDNLVNYYLHPDPHDGGEEAPGAPLLKSGSFPQAAQYIPYIAKPLVGLGLDFHIPIRAVPQLERAKPEQMNDPRYDDLIVYLET